MYDKNNKEETIDPILAKTPLILRNAIFCYNYRVSILMQKLI